jgi:hypothetical protein
MRVAAAKDSVQMLLKVHAVAEAFSLRVEGELA